MPEQLNNEQFGELLMENDTFKLAILGHAALEAEIDAAIAEALQGEVPGELRSARFQIRLALAVGLGIIPNRFRGCPTLAKLRNDFAHAKMRDLDRGCARPRERVTAPWAACPGRRAAAAVGSSHASPG